MLSKLCLLLYIYMLLKQAQIIIFKIFVYLKKSSFQSASDVLTQGVYYGYILFCKMGQKPKTCRVVQSRSPARESAKLGHLVISFPSRNRRFDLIVHLG